jgi:HEAT repeat protein
VIAGRKIAPKIRASALIALGRIGNEEDCEVLLRSLRKLTEPAQVREAATVGLALIVRIEDPDLRARVRQHLGEVRSSHLSPRRLRDFAILVMGLRAQVDIPLRMATVGLCRDAARDVDEASAVAFACGLTADPSALPELLRAAGERELCGLRLHDVGRSHAVLGLGLSRSSRALPMLQKVLRSRSAGIHSRRSSALAMGRLLRELELELRAVRAAQGALRHHLEGASDPVLRGYCAVALGGAREPLCVESLIKAVTRRADPVARPYAALALGLAARRLEFKRVSEIRTVLMEELRRTKEIEFSSALMIAVGLSGAVEATELLVECLETESRPASVRGAAAQALGLLGVPAKRTREALRDALRARDPALASDAALALGLTGHRSTAAELVELLSTTSSKRLQAAVTLALGNLGQSTAITPLLSILTSELHRVSTRETAAVALGLLGGRHERDPLFDLDAYFNYFATTAATHELLMIY